VSTESVFFMAERFGYHAQSASPAGDVASPANSAVNMNARNRILAIALASDLDEDGLFSPAYPRF